MKKRFALAVLLLLILPGRVFATEPVAANRVLTLQDCIKMALAHNTQLRQAMGTLNLAKANVAVADSAYLPQAATTGGFSHAESSKIAFTGSSAGALGRKSNTFSEQTDVQQLLWDFGKTLNEMRLARENLSVSDYSFLEMQENTILNTKVAYYNVLKAQLLADAAKEKSSQARIHLAQVKGFLEQGLNQEFDITRSETENAGADLDYFLANKGLELAKANLNNVMGASGDTDYVVEPAKEVKPVEVDMIKALQQAGSSRVEILKLNAQVRAAEAALAADKKGNWPAISLNGGQDSSDSSIKGVGAVNSWNAGASIKWPWFDGFRSQAQVKAAQENLNISRIKAEEITLNIALEVREAVFGLREAKARIILTQKLDQKTRENLTITEARYAEGLSSEVDLSDAKTLAFSAKQEDAVSLAQYLASLARYEKAVGVIGEYAAKKPANEELKNNIDITQ